MIKDNISNLNIRIASVCKKSGINPDEIVLVGVTKYSSLDQAKEGIEAGLKHLGENYVKDAREKFLQLGCLEEKITKHMIGHLQSNKVKPAVETFDLIQSLDSLKIGLEIQKHAQSLGKVMDVLIQVNISGEEQKSGIEKDQVLDLIKEMLELKNVSIRGLMTIAPFTEDKDIIRKCFKDLRVLRDQINEKYLRDERLEMKYLSMGMSADYEIAIEEGSNMLRIGSAIFK